MSTAIPGYRRRPAQARTQERARRILAAAEELLVGEGYAAVTTSRVAAVAGIPVSSLYHLFRDRDSIIDALVAGYLDRFLDITDDISSAVEHHTVGLDQVVSELVDGYASLYRTEPGYRVLWLGGHLDGRLAAKDRDNSSRVAERLRTVLAEQPEAAHRPELVALACRVGVEIGDHLLRLAFQENPDGDPAILEQAKIAVTAYVRQALTRR
ncbi:TetR/AcrR family transcriptional regulator [Actinoalloteichus caeruleus]|uniref:TetR/AcrR family transcriptional regulator n=1 Tax=Actinoalloteichus cyanogriseus TaxID=2893586 RepID=UPI00047E241E|nr:TetR/AcrR family transcriptional regulator [Actinoalloteichus caeruleus]